MIQTNRSDETQTENHPEEQDHIHTQNMEDVEQTPWQEFFALLPTWLRSPIEEYARQIVAGVVVAIVGTLLISGYSIYRSGQEKAGATAFGFAMSANEPADMIKGMQKVIKEHAGTNAADHAVLMLASAQRDAGDMEASMKNFEKALKIFGPDSLAGQSALIGSGYVAESKGDYSKAADIYRQLADSDAGFEGIAISDQARVLAELGEKEKALACYEKLLETVPGGQSLDFIRYQVMKLSTEK